MDDMDEVLYTFVDSREDPPKLVSCIWLEKFSGFSCGRMDPLLGEKIPASIGIKTTDGKYGTFIEVTDEVIGMPAGEIIKKLLFWIFQHNYKKFPLSEGLCTQIL